MQRWTLLEQQEAREQGQVTPPVDIYAMCWRELTVELNQLSNRQTGFAVVDMNIQLVAARHFGKVL